MRACSFSCSGSRRDVVTGKRASARTRHSRDCAPGPSAESTGTASTLGIFAGRVKRAGRSTEARTTRAPFVRAAATERNPRRNAGPPRSHATVSGRACQRAEVRQPRLLERPMRTSRRPLSGTCLLARTRADPRLFSCTHQHVAGSSSPLRTSGGPSARRTRATATRPVTPRAGECLTCRWECGASVWTGIGLGARLVIEPDDAAVQLGAAAAREVRSR